MEQDHGLQPNLLFFTGDAAFGHLGDSPGNRISEQFSDAQILIETARTGFSREIPIENVFLVPGNHDVDRTKVADDQTKALDQESSLGVVESIIQSAAVRWQRYMERLSAYKQFLQDLGCSHLLSDEGRLIFGLQREINGSKVGIVGLNSAWSCCRDGEKGKLWMAGRWQVEATDFAVADSEVSIGLVHHPVNWLVEQEDPSLLRELERQFTFLLHGHEHQEWVTPTADGHIRIAAGACYESSRKKNGYNFVRLDLDTGEGQVWVRTYEPSGAGWIPSIVHSKTDNNGTWQFHTIRVGRKPGASVDPPDPTSDLLSLIKSDPVVRDELKEHLMERTLAKAQYLLHTGQQEQAVWYYEAATKLGANSFDAWSNLGFIYTNLGMASKAIEANNKALQLNPAAFQPRFNLAVATLHERQSFEEAISILEEVENNPELKSVDKLTVGKLYLYKGHALKELGRDTEALTQYDSAERIFSAIPRGRMFLGESHKCKGDILARQRSREEARKEYDKAVEAYSAPAFGQRKREVEEQIELLGRS